MDQNHSIKIPEEYRNIPASFFVLNPGAQVMLGGFIVFDQVARAEKKLKIRRKVAGALAAAWASTWAFFHPEKCHRTTWREHWGRKWMFE